MKKNILSSKLFTWIAILTITIATIFGCKQEETTQSGGYMVGKYEVFELNERSGKGSIEILIDAPDSLIVRFAPDSTFDNAVNAFLVRKGEKVWIIDTGFGRNIFTIMDSLGIDPINVSQVLLTHMHGDHIGGMLRDSTLLFPNAQVILSQKEFTYWSALGEKAQNAQNILNMYADKIIRQEPYDLDDKFEDGIHMIEAYGHTPGHVMFLIRDGKDQLLIWGDLVHASAIQFPHPEISVKYDVDPQAARETRQRVMKFVKENSITIAGMHLPHSKQFIPRIN
ncbi:Hydroxyacylglutathione hydrolase [bioreactor metagenome]|uniref:Hydroxyacylglutathione hydrolase n=1 Tax=bioreactor metagenome TaxID=1076179 RepID=A0A644X806_9ZZZZ|nr:MBL fold metallo-hydrolase [Rikenellaceae bacterium]